MERRRFLKLVLGALARLVAWPLGAAVVRRNERPRVWAWDEGPDPQAARLVSFQPPPEMGCAVCALLRRPGRVIVRKQGLKVWRSAEPEEVRRGDFVHISGDGVRCLEAVQVTAPDHLLPHRCSEMARHWREELFA